MVKGTKIDKFFPRFEAIIKAAQQHNSESTGGTIHPHVVSSGLSLTRLTAGGALAAGK